MVGCSRVAPPQPRPRGKCPARRSTGSMTLRRYADALYIDSRRASLGAPTMSDAINPRCRGRECGEREIDYASSPSTRTAPPADARRQRCGSSRRGAEWARRLRNRGGRWRQPRRGHVQSIRIARRGVRIVAATAIRRIDLSGTNSQIDLAECIPILPAQRRPAAGAQGLPNLAALRNLRGLTRPVPEGTLASSTILAVQAARWQAAETDELAVYPRESRITAFPGDGTRIESQRTLTSFRIAYVTPIRTRNRSPSWRTIVENTVWSVARRYTVRSAAVAHHGRSRARVRGPKTAGRTRYFYGG